MNMVRVLTYSTRRVFAKYSPRINKEVPHQFSTAQHHIIAWTPTNIPINPAISLQQIPFRKTHFGFFGKITEEVGHARVTNPLLEHALEEASRLKLVRRKSTYLVKNFLILNLVRSNPNLVKIGD